MTPANSLHFTCSLWGVDLPHVRDRLRRAVTLTSLWPLTQLLLVTVLQVLEFIYVGAHEAINLIQSQICDRDNWSHNCSLHCMLQTSHRCSLCEFCDIQAVSMDDHWGKRSLFTLWQHNRITSWLRDQTASQPKVFWERSFLFNILDWLCFDGNGLESFVPPQCGHTGTESTQRDGGLNPHLQPSQQTGVHSALSQKGEQKLFGTIINECWCRLKTQRSKGWWISFLDQAYRMSESLELLGVRLI